MNDPKNPDPTNPDGAPLGASRDAPLGAFSDLLPEIKQRWGFDTNLPKSSEPPGTPTEARSDVVWLVGEVERARDEVEAQAEFTKDWMFAHTRASDKLEDLTAACAEVLAILGSVHLASLVLGANGEKDVQNVQDAAAGVKKAATVLEAALKAVHAPWAPKEEE